VRYVVVYDIGDDRLRARIADLCEAFGYRVQESVFECDLEEKGLRELVGRLEREIAAIETSEIGNVRIYRICKECQRASMGIGETEKGAGGDPCIVI